jgi:hypothetical protein
VVEAQAAGAPAAPGLLLGAEPDDDPALVPAGALVSLADVGAGAGHFLLMDEVGLATVEALAQERGEGAERGRTLVMGAGSRAIRRGRAARCSWISRLSFGTWTGMNGIQFSGTWLAMTW